MKRKTEDKKVFSKKKWTIEVITYTDLTSSMNRTNEGFTLPDLLGICEFCRLEIIEQMMGRIKPTEIKRNVVKP
jgi:hypothetical protein